jgi:hypothetical protein
MEENKNKYNPDYTEEKDNRTGNYDEANDRLDFYDRFAKSTGQP